MCIGTNYSATCTPIWFSFCTLIHLHVLYIQLILQINILNSFEVIKLFVFSYPR